MTHKPLGEPFLRFWARADATSIRESATLLHLDSWAPGLMEGSAASVSGLRSGAETPLSAALTDQLAAEEVARAKVKEEARAEEEERAWLAMAELEKVQNAALDEATAAQARVEAVGKY